MWIRAPKLHPPLPSYMGGFDAMPWIETGINYEANWKLSYARPPGSHSPVCAQLEDSLQFLVDLGGF